jgi:hypothetical protein
MATIGLSRVIQSADIDQVERAEALEAQIVSPLHMNLGRFIQVSESNKSL